MDKTPDVTIDEALTATANVLRELRNDLRAEIAELRKRVESLESEQPPEDPEP